MKRLASSSVRPFALALLLATAGLLWLFLSRSDGLRTSHSRIAFISNRDGNWEIYVMPAPGPAAQVNPDGSGQTRLTDNPAEEWLPSWSPDGQHIAFVSNRDGGWGLYVMNVEQALREGDTAAVTPLTNGLENDWDPAWSPDGIRLAYSSFRDGNREIYMIGADGRAKTRLTNNPAEDWLPTWSPDGKRIAFVSDRDGDWEIYTMNADGSEQTNRTNNAADDWVPAWSPDGARIAFQSNRDGNWEIYTMPAPGPAAQVDTAGLEQTNLTNNPADDWDAAWSPDGRQMVFMSERDGNREIYTMDAEDGSGATRLTFNPAADKNPAWSP